MARPPSRAKRPLNVMADPELVDFAKSSGINISAVLDKALRAERALKWAEENAEAIKANNDRVEKEGLWSDHYRTW